MINKTINSNHVLDDIIGGLNAPFLRIPVPQILEDSHKSGYKILEVGKSYDKSYRDVDPSCTGKYAVVGFNYIDDLLVFRYKNSGEAINAVVGRNGMPYVQIEEQFKRRNHKVGTKKENEMPFSYKLFMRIGEYKRVKDLHPYELIDYIHVMLKEGRGEEASDFISRIKKSIDTCPEDKVLLVRLDKFSPSLLFMDKRMMGFRANGYTYHVGLIFSSKTKKEDDLIKKLGIVSYEK